MPVCGLCLDLAKHDMWIRCVESKFPWQQDFKAGREVTYSFYQCNRNKEATQGTLKGDTASSEFSGDCKDLGPHPPPQPSAAPWNNLSSLFWGKGRDKFKKSSLKGCLWKQKCRKDYKRKDFSLVDKAVLLAMGLGALATWAPAPGYLQRHLHFHQDSPLCLATWSSWWTQSVMKNSWATL